MSNWVDWIWDDRWLTFSKYLKVWEGEICCFYVGYAYRLKKQAPNISNDLFKEKSSSLIDFQSKVKKKKHEMVKIILD